jgi:phosphoglucosamine mutase
MTNFGIELALSRAGIAFLRANVGDRYVLELLKSSGGNLGGEASGHVLCLDRASTGDALVCALQVLEVMAETGKSLSELLCTVARVPQTMINVKINPGAKPLAHADVSAALLHAQATLQGRGRVVLRASGTEPVVRVTVEGEDATEVLRIAETLSEVVKRVSQKL